MTSDSAAAAAGVEWLLHRGCGSNRQPSTLWRMGQGTWYVAKGASIGRATLPLADCGDAASEPTVREFSVVEDVAEVAGEGSRSAGGVWNDSGAGGGGVIRQRTTAARAYMHAHCGRAWSADRSVNAYTRSPACTACPPQALTAARRQPVRMADRAMGMLCMASMHVGEDLRMSVWKLTARVVRKMVTRAMRPLGPKAICSRSDGRPHCKAA